MTTNTTLWTKFENQALNSGLSKKRQDKLQVMFNTVTRFLDLNKAKRPEIEEFINNLNRDKARKKNGQPFSGSTKADIKKFLKQFYKTIYGKGEYYPPAVSWIKSKISKEERPQEKPIVTEKEVREIAAHFERPQYKMVVLLLFDSGFRIQEMLSVKKHDFSLQDYDDEGHKCYWIRCNVSKTEIRKIPVPLFTAEINTFMESLFYQKLNDDDLLFQISHPALSNRLKVICGKIFGYNENGQPKKIITPHCLRHSSACHYADTLNGDLIQLANRYGWSYSSSELKTYVRRSAAIHRKGAQISFKTEVMKLKDENAQLRDRMAALEDFVKTQLPEIVSQQIIGDSLQQLANIRRR